MISFFRNIFGQSNQQELAKLIEDGAFLVDVRSPQEFATGSAIGATNIPLDTIVKELTKFNTKKHTVVFCKSGIRSGQAKILLKQNGVNNVTNGGTLKNINQIKNKI